MGLTLDQIKERQQRRATNSHQDIQTLLDLYTEGDNARQIVADLKRTGWIWNIKPTPAGVAHHITQFLVHDEGIDIEAGYEDSQHIKESLMTHSLVREIATLLQKHRRR